VAIYELFRKVGLKRHFKIYEKSPKNIKGTSCSCICKTEPKKRYQQLRRVKFFSGNLPTEHPEV